MTVVFVIAGAVALLVIFRFVTYLLFGSVREP